MRTLCSQTRRAALSRAAAQHLVSPQNTLPTAVANCIARLGCRRHACVVAVRCGRRFCDFRCALRVLRVFAAVVVAPRLRSAPLCVVTGMIPKELQPHGHRVQRCR